jgi:MarR family transcriptional regulator, organic hydroperoxide resistance regulator
VISQQDAAADWELGKLVHDLDMQNNARMRARVARLDLTTAQASALYELVKPMTIGELAGRMSCEPSNATAVIDKLEDFQLIERRPHPSDRRAKQLHVTAEGAARRKRLMALLREELMITGLTDQERETLRELLSRALAH